MPVRSPCRLVRPQRSTRCPRAASPSSFRQRRPTTRLRKGSDYRRTSSNFTFNQSDFSRTDINGQFRYQATRDITVSLIDDTADEPDEDFTITLAYRGTTQTHYTGGSAEATVTIIDNEVPQVTLGWEETSFVVEEPTTPGGTTRLCLHRCREHSRRPAPGDRLHPRFQCGNG